MKLKHSVMLGVMGGYADRFHQYQPPRTFQEKLALARQVNGIAGIEVVFPQEFRDPDMQTTISAIRDSGLPVSAVNLNLKGDNKWRNGSFTSSESAIRADAVATMKAALDVAAELKSDMITCCPLIDGHDYAFQADYLQQWRRLEEGLGEAARHRSDIKISLEYKLNESRNYNLLSDVGRTLYLCEKIGEPHIGVTADVGHALIAKETPAEAMCLAAQAGKLFYVHLNDNGREWDWDMIPGSVNLWDLIEVFYYLDRLDWDGWLSYDVFTRHGDPVETMNAALSIVDSCLELLGKIGRDRLSEFCNQGVPARAFAHLMRSLL